MVGQWGVGKELCGQPGLGACSFSELLSHFGGQQLPRTAHQSATLNGDMSDLAYTCPFSHSRSTLCRHDGAVQTQPRGFRGARPLLGMKLESPTWNESAFVVGICYPHPPSPARPGMSFSFSLSPCPSQPSRHLKSGSSGKRGLLQH